MEPVNDRTPRRSVTSALAPPLTIRARRRRLVCLLTTFHAEPSLCRVLVRELSLEMPDIDFTWVDGAQVNVVWVCGYERGAPRHVRRARRTHPRATLVVTSRGPVELWGAEVLVAGADRACRWPVDYEELSRFLHERHVEGRR
jgi:hypothetical protein